MGNTCCWSSKQSFVVFALGTLFILAVCLLIHRVVFRFFPPFFFSPYILTVSAKHNQYTLKIVVRCQCHSINFRMTGSSLLESGIFVVAQFLMVTSRSETSDYEFWDMRVLKQRCW